MIAAHRGRRTWPSLVAALLLLAPPAEAEVPLDPGQAATIRLSPQRELAYPVPPPLTRPPANHGAILGIDIEEAGRYHVALGAPGWIDVLRDGARLPVLGRDRGSEAPGGGGTIDVDLLPGHHVIALSGMAAGEARITVTR